jgi:hypothetical protein
MCILLRLDILMHKSITHRSSNNEVHPRKKEQSNASNGLGVNSSYSG